MDQAHRKYSHFQSPQGLLALPDRLDPQVVMVVMAVMVMTVQQAQQDRQALLDRMVQLALLDQQGVPDQQDPQVALGQRE